MQPSREIGRLIEILAALRHPETGCPWDLQQTHASLAPYALEEAYEVVDAIERDDGDDLRDELGDLLLQVVFHARLAEETGQFDFGDIVEGVTAKMVRRHPHVFTAKKKKAAVSGVDKIWDAMRARRQGASKEPAADDSPAHGLIAAMKAGEDKSALSNQLWETIKAEERREKQGGDAPVQSVLDGVPSNLPGLSRATKLQEKASSVGFDWLDAKLVLAKIREEIDEVEQEIERADEAAAAGEIGDLLFAVANLARHVKCDPEAALRVTNRKFEQRFAFIETALADRGSSVAAATLDEMDALWNDAKRDTSGL